jgi:hypothetical protein
MVDKDNFSDKRHSKDKSCNVDRKKLIELCESNNFEILNGKFGSSCHVFRDGRTDKTLL